jgi:hypothetical protein
VLKGRSHHVANGIIVIHAQDSGHDEVFGRNHARNETTGRSVGVMAAATPGGSVIGENRPTPLHVQIAWMTGHCAAGVPISSLSIAEDDFACALYLSITFITAFFSALVE